MPSSVQKTTADQLADALELIRKKNLELNNRDQLIRSLRRANDTAEEIRRVIFNISEHDPAPPAWTRGHPVNAHSHRGGPVTMWSDWHGGEVIDKDQVGGVNEYNTEICVARAHRLVDTTIDLCFNHMGRSNKTFPGIIICLGGDMISGNIHEELAETNDRTSWQAVNDITDLLIGCIDTMATKFGNVFLPCCVGNHGRGTMKPRLKNAVYTSFDWSIYCSVARHFKNNKHVKFMIPSQTDARFNVYGHRFLLTHGDNLGVKGGDGIIGAIGPIMRGSMKVHTSEAEIGRDFDTLLIGHYHQYIAIPGLVVNNSLKGFDDYAKLRLRAKYSRPSQALFFVHPQHGITAHWQVYLEPKFKHIENQEWLSWPT